MNEIWLALFSSSGSAARHLLALYWESPPSDFGFDWDPSRSVAYQGLCGWLIHRPSGDRVEVNIKFPR